MNVLYIHTHDTGRYSSVYGKNVRTDNLKKFAEDSLVFRNAFCASPTCSPSRTSLLTGQYAHVNGMLGLAHRGFELNNVEHHLANYLKSNGYYTVLSGVQHELGYWTGDDTINSSKKLGYIENVTATIIDKTAAGYMKWDEENADNVCDFLENRDNGKPFFISYGSFATHREYPEIDEEEKFIYNANYVDLPNGVVDNIKNREDTVKLNKSIEKFDNCFGKIINKLKETNQYNNTIIVVTTDHGLANPFSKCNLSDEGTGVMFMLRNPEYKHNFGKVYEHLFSHIDFYPTLCNMLNLDLPQYLQGENFSEALIELKEVRKNLFTEINFHTSYEPCRSIRTKRYKLIKYYDDDFKKYNLSNCDESPIKTNLINKGWEKKNKDKEYLYDLDFDPCEKDNLINNEEYIEVYNLLSEELSKWRTDYEDNVPKIEEYSQTCKINKRECINPSILTSDEIEV